MDMANIRRLRILQTCRIDRWPEETARAVGLEDICKLLLVLVLGSCPDTLRHDTLQPSFSATSLFSRYNDFR